MSRRRILHIYLLTSVTTGAYVDSILPRVEVFDITVCTYFSPECPPVDGIKYYEGDSTLKTFIYNLNQALRDNEYDIVHVHAPDAGLLFLLVALFKRYSLEHTVLTVQNSYPNYKLRHRLELLICLSLYQRIIFCSKSSYQSFPRVFKWLGGKRLSAIPNGANTQWIDTITANLPASYPNNVEFIVVVVGRLIPIKQPLTVLQAFKEACAETNSRLVFIGEGFLRQVILDEAKALGIESQVELTGLISREEVYKRLAQSSLCVSMSAGEGLPVAVLEVMACRCPVVLSNIPSHQEIAEGVDFIPLVECDDLNKLRFEIEYFRLMNPQERKKIGQKCRELVEEKFSLAAMHAQYDAIYEQLRRR